MIQIILTWQGNWDILESPYHSKRLISEMVDNTFLLILNEADDFDALEQEMENQVDDEGDEYDLLVVGTYNMDGTQYQWGNPNSNRHHKIAKYKGKLKDVIEYDDEGNPIGSHPPTEEESLNTQVNKIAGWGDRILSDTPTATTNPNKK